MTIGTGADRIDLYYFGRGHTNGDAWVVFPALRAMHAGDIFSGKNIPGLDAVNGGSGLAIADTLTKAADTIKNIDSIITGHSSTMTVADLREYAQFNRDFANDVRAGKGRRKVGGGSGESVDNPGEICGLCRADSGEAAAERTGPLRRAEVGRPEARPP
jgi:glyoxylase-like metal-dependent hydrolase (beta-lactamase superfamily II)